MRTQPWRHYRETRETKQVTYRFLVHLTSMSWSICHSHTNRTLPRRELPAVGLGAQRSRFSSCWLLLGEFTLLFRWTEQGWGEFSRAVSLEVVETKTASCLKCVWSSDVIKRCLRWKPAVSVLPGLPVCASFLHPGIRCVLHFFTLEFSACFISSLWKAKKPCLNRSHLLTDAPCACYEQDCWSVHRSKSANTDI